VQKTSAHDRRVRIFSGITALLGVWLLTSPWIVGAPNQRVVTSAMGVGVLVVLFALGRLAWKRTAAFSWATLLLGAWTLMSPWVLARPTGDFRTWNYVIVGMLLAAMQAYSLTSSATQPNWRQRQTGQRSG
jgi:hypothetical protein